MGVTLNTARKRPPHATRVECVSVCKYIYRIICSSVHPIEVVDIFSVWRGWVGGVKNSISLYV